jgi:hypothetical protein
MVFVSMEFIPQASASLTKRLSVACGAIFFVGVSFTQAQDVTLHKVPALTVEQAPLYPENLARFALGAQLQVSPEGDSKEKLRLSSMAEDHNSSASALLCDDPTVGYGLQNGSTTILVSLPNIENVETLGFLSEGGHGTVSIATSNAQLPADSPQWRNAGQQELTAGSVKAKIGPVEAKYVRVTFNMTEPGRIAGFGLYSTPAVSDFTMPRPRQVSFQNKPQDVALISSNAIDVHAKARALYVSSGADPKDANKMIDSQTATTFTFAGNDANPVAVIDLGKESKLRRLSAIYTPRKGTVEFYVLKSLPVVAQTENDQLKADALQKGAPAGQTPAATAATELASDLTFNTAVLNNLKPVASVTNNEGEGRAAVDFPEASGRYVMVRWSAPATQSPLSVAEIAAFGGTKAAPAEMFAANDQSAGRKYVDAKDMYDGKSIIDNKDIPAEAPEEPAEGPPPPLPYAPPFTFIPEVVPTSP